MELLGGLLEEGRVVVDVGANIGTHTVFFAKAVGENGWVHAFEPQRLIFQNLCANLALNELTNVACHQLAVGDKPGSALTPIFDPRKPNAYGSAHLLTDGSPGEKVGLIRLDDLNLPLCDLVKIDVERMEAVVLRGAARTITALKPGLMKKVWAWGFWEDRY
jgi:FkbM family methyltransferase